MRATDLACDLTTLDASSSDAALLAVLGCGDPRDRDAALILHTRHAATLRAAAFTELRDHSMEAADEVVVGVFLALLFGAATAFRPARDEAIPWLERLARRTATEHVRAGALGSPPSRAKAVEHRRDAVEELAAGLDLPRRHVAPGDCHP
jgi:DNA-directed RNA polymerase specialized sigma24 family protein